MASQNSPSFSQVEKAKVRDYVGISALITAIATGACLIYTTFINNKDDKQDRMIESIFELMDYRLKALEAHDGIPSPTPMHLTDDHNKVTPSNIIAVPASPSIAFSAPTVVTKSKAVRVPKNFAELKGLVDKTDKVWSPSISGRTGD